MQGNSTINVGIICTSTFRVHDRSGFDFMSPTVFQYIVKPDVTAIDPPQEDVPDMEVVQ